MAYDQQAADYHMLNGMMEYLHLFLEHQVPGILPWHLLAAQCRWESSFDPRAVSSAGAKGIAQFMDDTWRQVGHGSPFNPMEAIKAQGKYMLYLAMLHAETGWTAPFWWVVSYTWGFGRVQRIQCVEQVPPSVWNHAHKVIETSEYYRQRMRYNSHVEF